QYVDDVMRTRERAFNLNPKVNFSKGLIDFYDDMKEAIDNKNDVKALQLINENLNTEKNLNVKVDIGIPLYWSSWDFVGGDLEFRPQIKGEVESGLSMSIVEGDSVGINLDAALCDKIKEFLNDQNFNCNSITTDPFINAYGHLTYKAGLNLDFTLFKH